MPARHPNGFAKRRIKKPSVIATILRPVNSSPYSLNRSYTVSPGHAPGSPPGARCCFRYRSYEMERYPYRGPVIASNLSKWSLPSNFLHGSFNGPTQEYQRTVHSHAEHPLYSRLRFSRGTRKAAR